MVFQLPLPPKFSWFIPRQRKICSRNCEDLVDGDEITIYLDKQDSPHDLSPSNEVNDREPALFQKRLSNRKEKKRKETMRDMNF